MKHRTFLSLILLTLFLQGCLSRTRVIPQDQRLLPAQTLDRSALIERLDEQSRAVQRMTATVTLDASGGALKTGVLTEYRQTRGILVVNRPSNIRLRVQAPLALATVADMVSDGHEYRVSIPIRNKFIVGDPSAPPTSDNLLSNLRPNHLMEGMFINTVAHKDNPAIRITLEEMTVGQRRFYIVGFINIAPENAQLVEKIWVDRADLEIVRKQIFSTDGKLETDVEYLQYEKMGDIRFPQVINIQRPVEDYALRMTFEPERTTFNAELSADAFRLDAPSGAELVQLNSR